MTEDQARKHWVARVDASDVTFAVTHTPKTVFVVLEDGTVLPWRVGRGEAGVGDRPTPGR